MLKNRKLRTSYKDISQKEKEDLLVLFYFKNIQQNALAEIFKTSYYTVSRIISEDIKQRQNEDANK